MCIRDSFAIVDDNTTNERYRFTVPDGDGIKALFVLAGDVSPDPNGDEELGGYLLRSSRATIFDWTDVEPLAPEFPNP